MKMENIPLDLDSLIQLRDLLDVYVDRHEWLVKLNKKYENEYLPKLNRAQEVRRKIVSAIKSEVGKKIYKHANQ